MSDTVLLSLLLTSLASRLHFMTKTSELLRKRHSVSNIVIHLIFTTKYRRKKMTRDVLAYTIDTLRYEAEKIGCSPIEINGEADHIHLLLRFPPDLSAAKAVCLLKSRSSGAVLKRFPFLRTYSASGSFWSASYFAASAGGVTIETLEKYVRNQGKSNAFHPRPVGRGFPGGWAKL